MEYWTPGRPRRTITLELDSMEPLGSISSAQDRVRGTWETDVGCHFPGRVGPSDPESGSDPRGPVCTGVTSVLRTHVTPCTDSSLYEYPSGCGV